MSFYTAARLTTTGSGAVNFSQISSFDASTLRVGFVPSEDSLSLFNQLADADADKVDIKTHYSSVNWDSSVTGYRLSTPYFVNYYNGTTTKFLAITDIISAYGETMLLFPDAIQNWINEGKQISNYAGVAPASGWDVVPSNATFQETTFSITYGLIGVYDGSGRLYFSSTQLVTSYPSFQERIGFVVSGSSTNLFNYLADSDPNKVDLKSIHPFTWSPLYPITGYRLSTPVYVNYFNGTETKLLACTDITNGFGHTCFLFPDAFDNWVNDGKVLQQGYSAPSDGFDAVTTGATFEITSAPPDTEIPVITLVGDASISINKGDTYTEQGATWTDNVDGSGNATIGGDTVDTSTVGTYVVRYNYTDAAGNVATEVTRTVVVENRALITHVLDGVYAYYASTRSSNYVRGFGISDNRSLYNWVKTQPHTVIVAEGEPGKSGAMGSVGSSYGEIIEPDFDMKVQVSHATNGISEVTVDRITYGVTTSGLGLGTNFTIKSPEHFHVYPSYILYDETLDFNPSDTEIPVITLTGDASITLTQGDTYTEQGATWTDNVDGSGDAVVTGSVDTSTPGSYVVTYNYTDAAGNVATEVTRTITVMASSSIRKVISQASFFDPSGTSQYFNGIARGYVLIDNWDLHNWVKTQPHTVLASSANGDSDGVMRNALGLTTGNWSEVLTPDFDLKVQVSNGSGTTEYSVTHIGHLLYTYVNGTKVTGGTSIIVSPEHTYYTSTNVLYDTTQDFNPTVPTHTTSLSDSVSLEMLWAEAGTFTMGSPETESGRNIDETQHQVTLTKGFYLGKYEVTQEQYEAVMTGNSDGLSATPSAFSGTNLPVDSVSWDNIQVFLSRLNEQQADNLPEGWSYVLPTEAQWEYACRAGTTTAYSVGDTLAASDAKFGSGPPASVGSYPANPWGFYDMHGNMWEWTRDAYNGDVYADYTTMRTAGDYGSDPQTDPFNETGHSNNSKVLRGGSWDDSASRLRSAERLPTRPDYSPVMYSFRIALTGGDYPIGYEPPDTEKPVITLTGDASITLTQGDTYTEQGATWTDNVDGSGDAVVTGSVDTSTIGTYTITYNYTDAAGNVATEVTRTVDVIAPTPTTTATVIDPGSGYTEPGTDVPTTGGSGTGLKVSYGVDNGGVTGVTITDDGTGYDDGDEVEIPGGTTPAVLLVDIPGGVNTNSILYKIGRAIKTATETASATGGAVSIDGLSDVQTSGTHVPTDGQALIWDQTMGHWMPKEVTDSTYVDQKVLELRTELTTKDSPAVDSGYRNLFSEVLADQELVPLGIYTIISLTTGDDIYGDEGTVVFRHPDNSTSAVDFRMIKKSEHGTIFKYLAEDGVTEVTATDLGFPNEEDILRPRTPNVTPSVGGHLIIESSYRASSEVILAQGARYVIDAYDAPSGNVAIRHPDATNSPNSDGEGRLWLQSGDRGDRWELYNQTVYFIELINSISLTTWFDHKDHRQRIEALETAPIIPQYFIEDLPEYFLGTVAYDKTNHELVTFDNGQWFKADGTLIVDYRLDVFILTGQSNADGKADISNLSSAGDDRSENLIYIGSIADGKTPSTITSTDDWLEGNWESVDLSNGGNVARQSGKFGPEVGFIDTYSTTQRVAVLKFALGGTSLADGLNATTPGLVYEMLKLSITDGLDKLTSQGYGYNVKGLMFLQGESDAEDSTDASNYSINLTNFMGGVQEHLGVTDLPTVVIGIDSSFYQAWPYTTQVRDAQIAYADTSPYISFVDASGYSLRSDGAHYDADGQIGIGTEVASSMAKAISGNSDAWLPSDITGIRTWYDAEDSESLTYSSSSLISEWKNRVIGAPSLVQSAAANQARAEEFENRRVVRSFDIATPKSLIGDDFISVTNNKIAIHFVCKQYSYLNLAWATILDLDQSGGDNKDFTFGLSSDGNQGRQTDCHGFVIGGTGTQWFDTDKPVPKVLGQETETIVMSIIHDYNETDVVRTTRCNGIVVCSKSYGINDGRKLADNIKFKLFTRGTTGNTNTANASVSELLAFDEVDTNTTEKAEGYLAHKWGVTLDSNHPYATEAP
jgi:sulfatase modifying factor 1